MDFSKLKPGEIVAAIGGVVVLVGILFLNWYGMPSGKFLAGFGIDTSLGAWNANNFLEVVANLIILAAGIVGIGLAIVKLASKSVALPVAASAITAGAGIAAAVLVVLRILIKPVSGLDLEFGIFVTLVGAVVLLVGGWMSMKEEGTTFSEAKDQIGDRMGSSSDSGGDPPSQGGSPPSQGGSPPSSGGGAPPPPPGGDSAA